MPESKDPGYLSGNDNPKGILTLVMDAGSSE